MVNFSPLAAEIVSLVSGRQPNFAALNRGRHLYSARRPSRWALAHISSYAFFATFILWNYGHWPGLWPCTCCPRGHTWSTQCLAVGGLVYVHRKLHSRLDLVPCVQQPRGACSTCTIWFLAREPPEQFITDTTSLRGVLRIGNLDVDGRPAHSWL